MKPGFTSGLTGIIQKTQGKTAKGQCGSEQGEELTCPQAPPTANFRAKLKKSQAAQNKCRSNLPVPQENTESKRAVFNRKITQLKGSFIVKEANSERSGNLPILPLICFLLKQWAWLDTSAFCKQNPKVIIAHHWNQRRHSTHPPLAAGSNILFLSFEIFLIFYLKVKINKYKCIYIIYLFIYITCRYGVLKIRKYFAYKSDLHPKKKVRKT